MGKIAMDHSHYMDMALEEAKLAYELGEVPIGAVVVHEPYDRATRKVIGPQTIVGKGHNLLETLKDSSAHAEFMAMKEAMQTLDAWRLTDCTVYVTLEPCVMCAGLMYQSRIARCVFGAPAPKSGACGTLYEINADPRLNHNFEVIAGVREEECQQLLQQFFKERRSCDA